MSAYMFIKAKVIDRQCWIKYLEEVRPLAEKYGRSLLVISQPIEILEGSLEEWGDYFLILSEWPSIDIAREFWNSAEYAEVKKLREGAGDVHVILTDGFPKLI